MMSARCSHRRWLILGAALLVASVTACSGQSEAPSVEPPEATSSSIPETVFPANWLLDPAFAPPSATDTEVHVLVKERECASGQPPANRLQPPQIEASASEIVVTFFVESMLVTEITVTCPDNPSIPYLLNLGEPLGNRTLKDGGPPSPTE
jgi:hypothetical protein